jgi:hypothetical protein
VVEGVVELEADGASSRNRNGLRRLSWAHVAPHIVASDACDRGVVNGLSDSSAGGSSTSDESRPDVYRYVVSRDQTRRVSDEQ